MSESGPAQGFFLLTDLLPLLRGQGLFTTNAIQIKGD